VTLHQASRGFHRLVVLFVERWATVREPTLPARQALIEAYVHLRLLDRAFSRVEALVAEGDAPAAIWRLGVEVLRMRGWLDEATSFARRAEQAFPDDASMSALVDQASEPWQPPIVDDDPLARAIAVAEASMREGQLVRAQVELQRLRRQSPRRIARVDELLWAIRGDFTMDASIEQLVPLLMPRPESSDTLVPVEDDALGGEASTEAFRQLFQNLEVPDDESFDPALEEPTHITATAGAEAGDLAEVVDLLPRAEEALESDTQVARVGPRDAPVDAVEAAFEGGDHSDYASPEHLEDDAIVVVTRRVGSREPVITEPFAAEVARVTLDARQEEVARAELAATPVERFLRPSPEPPPPRFTELLRARIQEEGRSVAFWAGGAAVLLFFGVLMFALAAWVAIN